MNIANTQILFQESVDNSTSTLNWLLLSKAAQKFNVGQIRTANTFANLPAAANNTGLLVYVTADERLYWSTGTQWYNLLDSGQGLVWSWGNNNYRQLGDGTTTDKSSPVSLVGGFTDWCQVSTFQNHTVAIRSNGTIWGWGMNNRGQLADGTNTTRRSSPVSAVGGFTDWCQVASSHYGSFGLRSSGTLWGWGCNITGRIGNNNASGYLCSPVSVVGGFTDWSKIASGREHAVGLRSNGTIWAWGSNGSGQLGDNTTTNRSSPVSVVGGFTDWCQVFSGASYDHSVAIRTNGTVWAWGSNNCGRLGDNSTTNRSSPVSVVGGFTDWCQAAAGGFFSIALRRNGTLWSWGYNFGHLGDNTIICRSSPVSVVGGFTDWCQVSAGSHSLGLRTNGTVWSWGNNDLGQLGINSSGPRSSPVSVVGGFTDWSQISSGTCISSVIRRTCF